MGLADDARDSLDKLQLLMRSQTKWKQDSPVEEIFKVLDSYLGLQQKRFGNRLSYSLRLEPELYGKYLMTFILQPIVENAVVHGCETNRKHTDIVVSGVEVDGGTRFTVNDNGVGIPEDKLDALNRMLSDPDAAEPFVDGEKRHHVGIVNVSRRIKLRYGERYGISIVSAPGVGTEVTVALPPLNNKEDENVPDDNC